MSREWQGFEAWEIGEGQRILGDDEDYLELLARRTVDDDRKVTTPAIPAIPHGPKTTRFRRPVPAAALFASPEMGLRYPGEVERSREGADEGAGRGWDDMDRSAGVSRSIMTADPAAMVVDWFAEQLADLGWRVEGDAMFTRDYGESFGVRTDWDRGSSRVADAARSDEGRRLVEHFEASLCRGVPDDWSVLTIFYVVAPA